METLDRLSESLDLTDFASRIIHPVIRTLDSCPDLRTTAMDTLCSLVFQLGKQYSTFIPTVNKVQLALTGYLMLVSVVVTWWWWWLYMDIIRGQQYCSRGFHPFYSETKDHVISV